ncbi:MAG: alpha/beta hydrolase fold protein, partial [Ilumatobacteraceae bacterium]|nr:alpha/beta hydrolase fold protein [Ilumatobacteraceae bacterium]
MTTTIDVQHCAEGRATSPRGHIGRVVAGSLVFGLVAVIGLVCGPLAGAKEHIITGSVLTTFALAWAMLALLSHRWTDQPQRWAIAPAAFMGLAGIGILIFAPTGNRLGWVWPPVVVMLTTWMVVRARHDLRSRTRVWLLYPVCAALFVSALGGGYESIREATDA